MNVTLAMLMLLHVEPSADALRADATALYKKKQYPKACALFEKAAKASSDAPEVLADLGLCQMKLKRNDVALRTFRAALANRQATDQVRNNIFFNLKTMGIATSPGSMEGHRENVGRFDSGNMVFQDGCQDVPSTDPSCKKSLKVCLSAGDTASLESYDHDLSRACGTFITEAEVVSIDGSTETALWFENSVSGGCSTISPSSSPAWSQECQLLWVDGCARKLVVECIKSYTTESVESKAVTTGNVTTRTDVTTSEEHREPSLFELTSE